MKNFIKEDSCQCAYCKNDIPFDMPPDLINDIKNQKVIIFAGAGISTENHIVFPDTLYDEISYDTGNEDNDNLSFPDLMSLFCSKRNGRLLLLQKIKKRFDYANSFPELYRHATRFHKELATLFFFDSIITTNWDDFFERECGALPIVNSQDFAFWDMPGRKVFKIHGSINSYSSIIATREDYEKCYLDLSTGVLGSYLKLILATKTIIFIGYSFKDDDFLRINDLISKEMAGIHPLVYTVTIDKTSENRFKDLGLIPIYTSGEYFLKAIKKELINQKAMLDDLVFSKIDYFQFEVSNLHEKLTKTINLKIFPDAIYTLSYQDGLIHSLERILSLRNSGYYSNPINSFRTIESYKLSRKEKLKKGNYFDVSYIDGYLDGLILLLDDIMKYEFPSPFYLFGSKEQINCLKDYKKILKNPPYFHKTAHMHAESFIKNIKPNKEITLHHTPFL